MSEAEQYDQEQCDSAKSDEAKKLIQIAMAKNVAIRHEYEIEKRHESLADCENWEHTQGV
jgi:hypothetical protein